MITDSRRLPQRTTPRVCPLTPVVLNQHYCVATFSLLLSSTNYNVSLLSLVCYFQPKKRMPAFSQLLPSINYTACLPNNVGCPQTTTHSVCPPMPYPKASTPYVCPLTPVVLNQLQCSLAPHAGCPQPTTPHVRPLSFDVFNQQHRMSASPAIVFKKEDYVSTISRLLASISNNACRPPTHIVLNQQPACLPSFTCCPQPATPRVCILTPRVLNQHHRVSSHLRRTSSASNTVSLIFHACCPQPTT